MKGFPKPPKTGNNVVWGKILPYHRPVCLSILQYQEETEEQTAHVPGSASGCNTYKKGAEETQIIWPSVTQPSPPCLDLLHQKMKRTNMISHKFRNAHMHWCLYWNETDGRQLRLISRSACILILTDGWKSGLAPKPLQFIQLCLHYDTKGNCEVWHGQRGSKHLKFMKVSYMNLAYPKTYSLVLKCLKLAQG